MSNLKLDEMNALLEGQLSDAERRQMVEAILNHPEDGKAFRALHQLRQSFHAEMAPTQKTGKRILSGFPKLRYALGAAAVMAMAVSPYLFHNEQIPQHTAKAPLLAHNSTPSSSNLKIQDQVKRINLIQESKKWGLGVDTRHLIDLTNQ